MHSVQIHKIISMISSFLYIIGFWHRGDKPTLKEITIKLFYCAYFLLFLISLVAGATTNEKNDQSIFLTELAIGTGVVATKLWLVIWKQDQIVDLLSRVCVFSIRNDEDFSRFNDKLRGFMIFVLVFVIAVTIGGFVTNAVLPFLGREKTLFLEIAFPLDWRHNENAFWIASVFLFTEATLSIIAIVLSVIIWYLFLICSLRYKVLGSELRNLGQDRKKGKVKVTKLQMQNNYFEDLKTSIDSHLHIRELTNDLESFFANVFFIQFGTSGLCICGSIYSLAFDTGDSLLELFTYLVLFFYFIAELFMITYFGNEIMLSSNSLSFSLFESDWYNQPQSTKKCIIIFGEYLKQPQKILVGKLYTLTLETFTRILNSAYSMFNILKSFQQ